MLKDKSKTYDKIMYNQTNWRDDAVGKDKNVARGDFNPQPKTEQMYQYRISRAMKYLGKFNDAHREGLSEVLDRFSVGEKATHIRGYLDEIPTGYEYYRCDGSFDYTGLDDDSDFEDYKIRVLEWMDDEGLWDAEEDDDEEDEEFDPDYDLFSPGEAQDKEEPAEPPVEDEDFSVSDLMSMCGAELLKIQKVAEQRRQEEDADMARLLGSIPYFV